MDRLSSCYFCGAALDASLSEYPIVPAELHPDDDQQQTVVLCPTCRRKLGQVVETVVGAMDGQSAVNDDSEPAVDSERRQAEADGAVEGDTENVGWMSAEDAVERGSTSPRSASPREDAAVDGSEEGLLGGANGADEGRNGARADSRKRARDGRRENGSTGGDGSELPNDQRAPGRSESTADEGNYADGRSAADVASERSEAADEGTDDPTDGEPSLTRLEYNKVMRLLQNREFPVDRAEIKAVATNAYEITDDEFERIIDAAVEHDLIDERDGQLVQAD